MPQLDNRRAPTQASGSRKPTDSVLVNNSDDHTMLDSQGLELLSDLLKDKSEKLELEQGSAKDAIIVLILGTLGAGKSSFIDKATENTGRGVGHDLRSGTKEVTFTKGVATDGSNVVLVDTPGLDTTQSPVAILGKVSTLLNEEYGTGTKPSVVLYFQPISPNREVWRPHKVIKELQVRWGWGEDAMSKVFFVTTMWDEMEDSEDGEERLKELEDRGAIPRGYPMLKHLNTRASAIELLDVIARWASKQEEIQSQREIQDMDRTGMRDIIIALVGQTGTGKSSFIDNVTGNTSEGVGHDLTRCTNEIKVTKCAIDGFNVMLVDTPGFNDTKNLSELEVLEMISNWLNTYETRPILSAILYFHRISDNRVSSSSGTPTNNLRILKTLCGKNVMTRISLVTTMWDKVENKIGEETLTELKKTHWKIFLRDTTCKHLNTRDSTMQIIESILQQTMEQEAFQLQEETSGMKLELWETTVTRELRCHLEDLAERRKEIVRRIRQEGKGTDQRAMRDLWKEYAQVKAGLDSALIEARKLRTIYICTAWISIIFAKMLVDRWADRGSDLE